MNDKAAVIITLESVIDGEKQVSVMDGEWYRKGGTFFLRYEETEAESAVRTVVRWRDGELSVTRRGDVESQQTFAAGVRRSGEYASRHASFALETETSLLWAQFGGLMDADPDGERLLPNLPLLLEWHYKLLVDGGQIGDFVIRLRAEAAPVG
ncbi:DUF1934 domain-containing protein [Paenibacillus sp. MWE-103]|uniref:DUF1934 domain-containing protein n=1 Tax=Paenibacillus artemisiicola TaxID=1172618 RepID=A0ABS3WK44_9BACL|nr:MULTISPECIES: DUF1934 domain-containing protein [Paenibacillus]MBO7748701.1 DUF1934 domain-containing protein [Paenibacillus artemisiicola]SFJ72213.1 Uncharacterized beta-barrel protein YwiB, DUF1934 family [Paenibacillus sp. UNC496MF]